MAGNVRDYIRVNEQHILEIVENITIRMEPQEKAEMKSLFEADYMHTSLIVLSTVFLALFFAGTVYSIIRFIAKRKKVSVVVSEREIKTKALKCCIDEFEQTCRRKIGKLIAKHNTERVKLYFDRGASSLRNQYTTSKSKAKKRNQEPGKKRSMATRPPGDSPLLPLQISDCVHETVLQYLTS